MEFTFEKDPWALWLEGCTPGSSLPATQALTLLQDLDQEQAQLALEELECLHITLDISHLPAHTHTGELANRLQLEEKLRKEDLLSQLSREDPLALYLQELWANPVREDPQSLARAYVQGQAAAAQALTDAMLPSVVDLALEMTGRGVLLLDLIQEGSLGLWQSILQYTRGDFCDHALWWIRQYMAKAVTLQAKADGVGQMLLRAMEDYRQVYDRLAAELAMTPTDEQLAQAMHMTPEQVTAVAELVQTARAMEFLKPRQEEPQSREEETGVEDTAYFQLRQRVTELLSCLPQQQARLMSLRYGLEGGLPLTPAEAGARLGLTAREAVELENQALQQLRNQEK